MSRARSCRRLDLLDRKYGHLVVLKRLGANEEGRIRWLVRCDCGQKYAVTSQQLTGTRSVPGVNRCRSCANKYGGSAHVVLKTGKTLGELARETGIKLNTLYVRWMRGWPHDRISEPLR